MGTQAAATAGGTTSDTGDSRTDPGGEPPDPRSVPRARCAEATAAALLDAAVTRFARDGYDATSVRDIAADAGVNPALIYRYFGSKEKLFVEVVSRDRDPSAVIDGPLDELADRSVTWFHNRPGDFGSEHPLALMLRSAGREGVADLMRAQVHSTVAALADRLDGPDAELRATLILSLHMGMGMLTSVADVRVLLDAPPERLRDHLAHAFAPLLAGSTEEAPGIPETSDSAEEPARAGESDRVSERLGTGRG